MSKKVKNVSGTRKDQEDEKIQRILEEFKGIRSISSIQTSEEKNLHPKNKNEKREKLSHQEKELPMSSVNSIANCMLTTNVMIKSWKQTKMRMKTRKEIKVLVFERRKKFQSSR